MRLIQQIGDWLDARLQLAASLRETTEASRPARNRQWSTFAARLCVVFVMQIITGMLLAVIYVPSAGEAWNSMQTLNHSIAFGWYIRALHGWV